VSYENCWHRLTKRYDADEAKAIVRWVLDVRFNLSWADILCDRVSALSADDQAELEHIMVRLEQGEPVQYVVGIAYFYGRQFHVGPGVLIPRPETEELCQWCLSTVSAEWEGSILDIGTGSGCIACTLAAERPHAKVTGWDISFKALRIASANAEVLGADVHFELIDILTLSNYEPNRWDIIVSNPPYVCEKEKEQMEHHVLDHEPSLALFVPDDDPLLFYRAIAKYSLKSLTSGGQLYLEINPHYAADLVELLLDSGLAGIEVHNDQYGKQRMIKAVKP
jgi:release factor glutamine methyltransferase